MKKYLYDYIAQIDEIIKSGNYNNLEKIKEEHLIKIKFFQHERLIHLIITLFYCVFMLIFFAISSLFLGFLIIAFILLIFVLFYIVHYFRLENGVQYLYVQYDKLNQLDNQNTKITFINSLTSKFIDKLLDRFNER